jgi:hypothetical protein
MRRHALLALPLLAACAVESPRMPPSAAVVSEPSAAVRWHAVLVAGDPSLPVWDNATATLAQRLGPSLAGARVFSARPIPGAEPAATPAVLRAVAELRPGPGEGCLVFASMHGAPGQGLAMMVSRDYLRPAALDRALAQGCGDAPTVAILSGCYSGLYARPPLARPNRAVLTAARPDRSSFGCAPGRTFTVYDECLLGALTPGATWGEVAAGTEACVAAEERRRNYTPPSEPQAALGAPAALVAVR